MAQNTFIVKSLQRTNGSYYAEIEFKRQRDRYEISCEGGYRMCLDNLGFAILDDNCKFPENGEFYLKIEGETPRAKTKQRELTRIMREFAFQQESIFKNTKT